MTRIVKLTFAPSHVQDFLNVFDENSEHIRGFRGCESMILLRDKQNPTIFFTYSTWQSEDHLEEYRKSELFAKVWGKVKLYFGARPEAWSCDLR